MNIASRVVPALAAPLLVVACHGAAAPLGVDAGAGAADAPPALDARAIDAPPASDAGADACVRTLVPAGGRVSWSRVLDLIAFDKIGADGYDDVWVIRPDGSGERCLTCGLPQLPLHNGNPAWSPDGAYLVFQSENADSTAGQHAANPGRGLDNNLWVMEMATGKVTQLTYLPSGASHGVLHPHFSADGTVLTWTQMYQASQLTKRALFGYWKLMRADFATDPQPALANASAFEPGDPPGFYENHGLSPDGNTWLFTANQDLTKSIADINDIYTMPAQGGPLTRLTSAAYNEHAHYSPDGSEILWMSTRDNANHGADFWVMDADGSSKRRITDLQGSGQVWVAADSSWGPDGVHFVGFVQAGALGDQGKIIIARADCSP